MVINDQTDNVYYALPSSRDKTRRQEHNLQKDISLNNSSAKKNEFYLYFYRVFHIKGPKVMASCSQYMSL